MERQARLCGVTILHPGTHWVDIETRIAMSAFGFSSHPDVQVLIADRMHRGCVL